MWEAGHLSLLESDVSFRKLVALAKKASQEIRTSSPSIELVHALFDYQSSLTDYYRELVYSKFAELMQIYQLDTTQVGLLARLGEEYEE